VQWLVTWKLMATSAPKGANTAGVPSPAAKLCPDEPYHLWQLVLHQALESSSARIMCPRCGELGVRPQWNRPYLNVVCYKPQCGYQTGHQGAIHLAKRNLLPDVMMAATEATSKTPVHQTKQPPVACMEEGDGQPESGCTECVTASDAPVPDPTANARPLSVHVHNTGTRFCAIESRIDIMLHAMSEISKKNSDMETTLASAVAVLRYLAGEPRNHPNAGNDSPELVGDSSAGGMSNQADHDATSGIAAPSSVPPATTPMVRTIARPHDPDHDRRRRILRSMITTV
jgi:hypothetical protein